MFRKISFLVLMVMLLLGSLPAIAQDTTPPVTARAHHQLVDGSERALRPAVVA